MLTPQSERTRRKVVTAVKSVRQAGMTQQNSYVNNRKRGEGTGETAVQIEVLKVRDSETQLTQA